MADKAGAPAPSSPEKKSKAKARKPRVKPNHPRTADMVGAAIKNLKERNGSSLQAIKKYIGATYKVDADRHAPFIKKYIKTAVGAGELVQTKGKGASGSFKLSMSKLEGGTKVKKVVKRSPSKKPAVDKPKKPAVKKSPKKVVKKPVGEKKVAKPVKKVVKKKSPPKKVISKPSAVKKPKKSPAKKKPAAKKATGAKRK